MSVDKNRSVAGKTGTLYLVGTPIGNLQDVSFRTLDILQHVDLIAAEDTRHTRKLLSHYDIHVPLTSFHSHNEDIKSNSLVQKIKEGNDIALVSKAGMPGISEARTLGIRELDSGETKSKVFELRIPNNMKSGFEQLRVSVSNDDYKRIIYRELLMK